MNKIKPVIYMFVLVWGVFILNKVLPYDLNIFGIIPRKLIGLRGIVCSPFLHANTAHIISNSLPFLILGSVLFIYYPKNALKVLFLSIGISGALVWVFARPNIHIGLSSVIYAFASFLIIAGFYRKNFWSVLIAIAVIIFYGGLIWGILPTNHFISWEGHLSGVLAGIYCGANYYKEK
jgi:membrane associated rhomboid family serine protease